MKRLLALGALLALAACATPAPATTQVSKARAPIIDSSQHLRIMPLGDSVTRGDGSSSGYGYRPTTLSYIRDVGGFSNATFVGSMTGGAGNHEGHPGWTITSLGNQISNWMQTYNPDIVLIYAGLNDAGQGAGAEQIASRMTDLLNQILALSPTVRVVVSDIIIPWGTNPLDVQSPALRGFNALLPGIVAAAGDRVTLAHMSRVVPNNMLGDKIHPNNLGYERMSWVWWRCTAPILAEPEKIRNGRDPLAVPVPQEEVCS